MVLGFKKWGIAQNRQMLIATSNIDDWQWIGALCPYSWDKLTNPHETQETTAISTHLQTAPGRDEKGLNRICKTCELEGNRADNTRKLVGKGVQNTCYLYFLAFFLHWWKASWFRYIRYTTFLDQEVNTMVSSHTNYEHGGCRLTGDTDANRLTSPGILWMLDFDPSFITSIKS